MPLARPKLGMPLKESRPPKSSKAVPLSVKEFSYKWISIGPIETGIGPSTIICSAEALQLKASDTSRAMRKAFGIGTNSWPCLHLTVAIQSAFSSTIYHKSSHDSQFYPDK